ncbi:MAG: tRNA 2-thiocytidine biosynthesis protein TtcA [Ruminococcus sp.]|nr:tRNA 2-thiocytidine biosynthesis protein TtcA [Ruminococcus sp.]
MNPIEETIAGKFGKQIWSRFNKSISTYELIQPGDKIAVCISGGKDSMLMSICIKRFQRFSKIPFEVEFLVMDPGYAPENRQKIESNLSILGIEARILDTNIFTSIEKENNNPCFLCARLRRGWLYKSAQELGCNKIALGHHFDDVVETILMGMLYGSQMQTMLPKLHSENYAGMQLIRPLYLVREKDIISWAEYNGLEFIRCACRMTENLSNETKVSKRQEIKDLLKDLRTVNPAVDMNIFRSAENVNLRKLISYHSGSEYHHFLDDYSEGISVRGTKSGEKHKNSPETNQRS